MDQSFLCHFRSGWRGDLNKTVQEFPYPKMVHGRSKENGLLLCREIGFLVEFRVDPMDQIQIVTQFGGMFGAYEFFQFRALDIVKGDGLLDVLFAVATEEVYVFFEDVVYALEIVSHADGETQGGDLKAQFLFHFIQ